VGAAATHRVIDPAILCEREEKTDENLDNCVGRVTEKKEENLEDFDNSDLLLAD
jgi:hypothetical protein